MPTLPTSTIDLSAGVSFVSQPSRTWYINKETNRIQGECDGWYSVRQAVEVILNVERFRWQIGMGSSGRTRGMWPRNFSGVSPRR